MGVLNRLSICIGNETKAAAVFEKLLPNFWDVNYEKPSEYIQKYWTEYLKIKDREIGVNGKIFEYSLATLFIREKLLPLYLSAKVSFVPNVIYDLMLYTEERGPICISAKTSLRERYKQADLEAIALKYVHRKALSYLVTLDEGEARSVSAKIKKGDVIGLDKVVVATSSEFDDLIEEIKAFKASEPPTLPVITSSQVVTVEKVQSVTSATR